MIKPDDPFTGLLLFVGLVVHAHSHQASVVTLFARRKAGLFLFRTNLKVRTASSSSCCSHLYLIFGTVLEMFPLLNLWHLSLVDIRWIYMLFLLRALCRNEVLRRSDKARGAASFRESLFS